MYDKCSTAYAELIADVFAGVLRQATAAAICCDERKQEITPSLMQCMELLYSQGSSSIGEIAVGLGISIPGASQLVDRLVKKGLVVRSESEADRRKARIALTALGADQVRETRQRRARWFASILEAMPEMHKQGFIAGLESFVRAALGDRGATRPPCVKCPAERTSECDSGWRDSR
ncbi:MAG: MarR family transcriptional regulator [Armatimonadota bacterium]|nr:MarR family transcriptional regulator [Armatimonadota bacterium]